MRGVHLQAPRRRFSLRLVLPGVVALLGLVISAFAIISEGIDSRDRAVGRAFDDLASTKSFVSNDLDAALRRGDDARAEDTIRSLSRNRDFSLAALVDPAGRVVYSTESRLEGRLLADTRFEPWAEVAADTSRSNISHHIDLSHDNLLLDLSPLGWTLAPGELLATTHGTLLLEYDLARVLGEARRDLVRRSLWLLGVVALLTLLALLVIDRLIGRRVDEVARFARAGLSESASPPLIGEWEDEVSDIARSLSELVTGARRQLLALEVSEQRFRNIVEGSSDWVFETNATGEITFTNQGCQRVVGLPEAKVRGTNIASYFPSEYADCLPPRSASRRRELSELRLARADGVERLVHLILQPGGGEGAPQVYHGVCSDITESRHLQQMQRQSQKLELVGQLAGGVAHDYNNLVAVMMGHCELLLLDGNLASAQRESLEEILECCQRSAELTRRLLAFGRRQVIEPKLVDLNQLVRDSCRLLERLVGASTGISTDLRSKPIWVRADPAQLEQVVVNLVINARDAMKDGGLVTIRTRLVEADPSAPRIASLVVEDQGIGMAKEVVDRVFEPFFTTKPPGEGTGLGLPTALGIVEQCGGTISVRSTLGVGSAFEIRIPEADLAGEDLPIVGSQGLSPPPGGKETILVVDDRDDVRIMVAIYLRGLGYAVHDVGQMSSALDFVSERAPDLALLDVVLAEGTGIELAERMRGVRPGMPVIFMSGYAAQLELQGELEPGVNFLRKPFTLDRLGRLVRQTIDSSGPQRMMV